MFLEKNKILNYINYMYIKLVQILEYENSIRIFGPVIEYSNIRIFVAIPNKYTKILN